jgi:hypothetical protein
MHRKAFEHKKSPGLWHFCPVNFIEWVINHRSACMKLYLYYSGQERESVA